MQMSGGMSLLVKLEIISHNFRGVVRDRQTSKIELLEKMVKSFR